MIPWMILGFNGIYWGWMGSSLDLLVIFPSDSTIWRHSMSRFFGSDSVYFWSSCHKGNKQPLIDHIDHFKGWLKYFEVLWSIDYWLLISYLQGHPRPLCPVDSMKQHETNHTHHTLHTPRAGQHGRHEVQSDFHKWLWMLWRVPKMAGNVPKYP